MEKRELFLREANEHLVVERGVNCLLLLGLNWRKMERNFGS